MLFRSTTTKLDGFDLPDPIAMAIAIDPTIVTKEARYFVDVVAGDSPARGQSFVDTLDTLKRSPNCRVIYEADRDRFLEVLRGSLALEES